MGAQLQGRTNLEGRTNSEGQVKYCRCTFLDMPRRIAQERVPTAPNVGSSDVTWASQPTPLIPLSRLFACFAGSPFLSQSEVVTENPIPDRSSCPLRPSVHLLFLHWVPVGDGFPEAKRDASTYMDFADLASTPLQSSGSPTPRPLWLRLRRAVIC